jgi:hypothetical protein
MANMDQWKDQWKDRLARLWSRFTTRPKFTLRYRHLVKMGFWVLAIAWISMAGSWVEIGNVFEPESAYVKQRNMARCKSLSTGTARFDCINAFIISRENTKFTRVLFTLVPVLLMIPVYRAARRRIGERGERPIQIAWE